jgi:GNAT superfamily N-acetyltransferase
MTSTSAWTVRDAATGDASAVGELAAAAWRDTYAGLLRDATIEAFVARAYSLESLERRIARHTFLMAEDGGRIVAFADVVPEADHLTLAAIYAHPEWRGRGAGTALLDEVRERFPEPPIAADVLVGNRKGEGFYARRGFLPREEIETDLFGERVVERRWWLDARLDT